MTTGHILSKNKKNATLWAFLNFWGRASFKGHKMTIISFIATMFGLNRS